MAQVTLGTGDGNYPKTPTLRQFIKEKNGNVPGRSFVKVIFKPKDYPAWTLVCEHGFKVNVYEESPLYGLLFDRIESFANDQDALFVAIVDKEKSTFELVIDTDENAEWEETSYGWKNKILPKKNRPSQNRSNGKKKGSDSDDGGMST